MIHYVYLLKSKISDKNYIGARSFNGKLSEDTYTREEAVKYEILLHNQFEVASNNSFWNRAKQTSTGWDQTGVIRSKSSRLKQSITNKKNGQRPPSHKGKSGKAHNRSKPVTLQFPDGTIKHYGSDLEVKRDLGIDYTSISLARTTRRLQNQPEYSFGKGKLKGYTFLIPHFELVKT